MDAKAQIQRFADVGDSAQHHSKQLMAHKASGWASTKELLTVTCT